MTFIDPAWYTAAEEPELVEFGTVHGLGISGRGEPGGPVHLHSIQTLFAVASPLLDLAAQAGTPFDMPPMEGRWWVEDDRPPFEVPRSEWCWQLFVRLPDELPAPLADHAREVAWQSNPAAPRVQLVTFTEGRCVQAMHNGPYSEEPETLAKMDSLISASDLEPNGLHHEIYLSDLLNETDPGKVHTVLRQPVRHRSELQA
jgi:hypothetical protein